VLIVKSWSHVTIGLFSKIEEGSLLGKSAPSLPLVKECIMIWWNMIRSMLAFAAIFGVAIASMHVTTEAEARRGVKPYYWRTYQFNRPVKGYEGWVAPGYYCSYKRYPRRTCTYKRSGKERCRITGWTLEQTCQ
jgi:hypothetical protein